MYPGTQNNMVRMYIAKRANTVPRGLCRIMYSNLGRNGLFAKDVKFVKKFPLFVFVLVFMLVESDGMELVDEEDGGAACCKFCWDCWRDSDSSSKDSDFCILSLFKSMNSDYEV